MRHRKTTRIALSCGIKNIAGRFFGLVTKHACDRQTADGQNYESQDRASIAASRGNKITKENTLNSLNFDLEIVHTTER